jgi:Fe2+ transport system protein B
MSQSVKIDAQALGKAWGLFWSAFVIFFGISSRFGWGKRWEALLEDVYPWYDQRMRGIAIGGILAFLDGFIDAYLIGALYNRFVSKS